MKDPLQPLLPVFRLLDLIIGRENMFQNTPVYEIVVHDQHRLRNRKGRMLPVIHPLLLSFPPPDPFYFF